MVTNRAKQFMPFDSLKGLQQALRQKEIEYEEKKELSEESNKELQNEFNKIEVGDKIQVKYYKHNKYNTIKQKVVKIDYIKRKIELSNCEKISLDDIVKIKKS